MRAAAMRPLEVPVGMGPLAASGGLEVPGRDPHGGEAVPSESPQRDMIPGERDPSNLTRSEPGAMGSLFGENLPSEPSTLTDVSRHEREMEGGLDKG
jgi:hypothetical protein